MSLTGSSEAVNKLIKGRERSNSTSTSSGSEGTLKRNLNQDATAQAPTSSTSVALDLAWSLEQLDKEIKFAATK